jgi:GxxExxY protein
MSEANRITGEIINASLRIHRRIGAGLLESVYEAVLARSLSDKGLIVERQKPVSFEFDGIVFEEGFRADLLVEGQVLVELKSVERLAPVHSKQVLTYIRLMDLHVGLLINFGAPLLKEGIRRVINGSPRIRPLV